MLWYIIVVFLIARSSEYPSILAQGGIPVEPLPRLLGAEVESNVYFFEEKLLPLP